MGQKSNKITLQKSYASFNLLTVDLRNFVKFFNFIKFFDFLLLKKNVILTRKIVNFSASILYLNFHLFYKSVKSSFYKRKNQIQLLKSNNIIFLKNLKLKNLFIKSFKNLKYSSIILNCKNVNILINKKLITFFYQKLKKFINSIFVRRFNLFVDFVKINSLYVQGIVSINTYIYFLGLIFKSLSKKTHSRFLIFLKNLFKILISDLKSLNLLDVLSISGMKCSIKGKLKGKTRSSINHISEGNLPLQSFNKEIDFAKNHTYTLIGAFGIKLWILKKK